MAATDIIDAIDDLIAQTILGASSTDALADRTIGDLSISAGTSLQSLMELRQKYVMIAHAEDPYMAEVEMR